jgi:hypothetical protein
MLKRVPISGLKGDSTSVRRQVPRAIRNQIRQGGISIEELIEKVSNLKVLPSNNTINNNFG